MLITLSLLGMILLVLVIFKGISWVMKLPYEDLKQLTYFLGLEITKSHEGIYIHKILDPWPIL